MSPIGAGTTVLQFVKLTIQNALGTTIKVNPSILKFTGTVTVTQVGAATVVNITAAALTGDPNTVPFFNAGGTFTDDPGNLIYNSVTKVFQYPKFTTVQRNALPAQPVGTLIFNTTDQEFQTWDGVMWNAINAGTATPPPGDPNTIATFNSLGAFGDDPNLTWISATMRLGIGNPAPQTRIHVRDDEGNVSVGVLQPTGVILGKTHPTANLGNYSVVIGGVSGGGSNSAPGNESFAGGELCTASGQQSFAMGQNNTASGQFTACFGLSNTASGNQSFTSGNLCVSSGLASFATGQNSVAQGFCQTVVGLNNIIQGTSGSFVTGDDAFIVGNGSGPRSNAFAVTNEGLVRMDQGGQRVKTTVDTGTPVAVSATTDYYKGINVAGASVVNLPAGVAGQELYIKDESGAAAANNITINRNGADTFQGGGATDVINNNFGFRHYIFRSGVWWTVGSA